MFDMAKILMKVLKNSDQLSGAYSLCDQTLLVRSLESLGIGGDKAM